MQKKKHGISLIVLVITIIVMIILAATVIISLNNIGIIKRAKSAVNEYNEDEANDVATLAWSEAYLGGARTVEELKAGVRAGLINAGIDPDDYGMIVTTSGVKVTKKWLQDGLTIIKGRVTLEVGDLIQYNAGVSGYEGAWKVLGAEDGNLLIMSTEDVAMLKLYGLEGDNDTTNYGLLNGMARINELCEPYGHGKGATQARSIKVEDIDRITGFDKKTYGENILAQYGNKVTYSWDLTTTGKVDYTSTNGVNGILGNSHSYKGFGYIDLNSMTKKTVPVNGTGMPTLISNFYSYSVINLSTISAKSRNMIVGANSSYNMYWLASPYLRTVPNNVEFGLYSIGYGSVDNTTLFLSTGYESQFNYGVRAVVSLSSGIIIGAKDATNGWSYTI